MTDSAYRAMQERGKAVMGVDQYTSTHRFDALRNGGRIELQRNSADDTAGIRHIRAHLRDLARAFKSGDFTSPHLVHMQAVTGTSIMAAKRDLITYTTRDLPRGGELVIETSDEGALAAIHRFIAFQRGEHRAGGLTDSASGNASQPAQNGRSKPLGGPVIVPGGLPMHLTATGTTQRARSCSSFTSRRSRRSRSSTIGSQASCAERGWHRGAMASQPARCSLPHDPGSPPSPGSLYIGSYA